MDDRRLVACVGAVVHDEAGRLLVIRRRNEPAAGRWSLPGGRVEPGESDEVAVAREVAEETGLQVVVGPLLGRLELPGPAGALYQVADHRASVVGGTLAAGDDASEADWVTRQELLALPTTDRLVETLDSWQVWPAAER